MHNKCLWRFLVIAAALVALVVLAVVQPRQAETCLGVELIEPEQAAAYTENGFHDAADLLQYNGEPVPVDVATSTVYLAVQPGMAAKELVGRLELSIGRLFFVRDDAFDNMAEAVAQGHVFTLLATNSAHGCMKFNVVFTTLPVLSLTQSDVDGEELYGRLCVWDPYNEAGGTAMALGERVSWHLRGRSTRVEPKSGWKLNVLKETGTAKNVDIAGLGSDDDWILNPMCMDDTRVREKLLMGLWNQIAEQSEWDEPCSTGEYVELLINGEYRGLYLLQRRIDRKYLGLEDELLFKGHASATADTVMDVYQLVYSPLNMASSYETMTSVWKDSAKWDLNNFIDLSAFLQFGVLGDNTGYQNMFYLLQPQEDGYIRSMIPWDMDLSFGTAWVDGAGFQYKGDDTLTYSAKRGEYDEMLALHPEMEQQLSARWLELRQGVLSWENIEATLDRSIQTILESGAYERDFETWEPRYGGQDTHEVLKQWIQDRLQWCDEYYANK